MLRDAALFGDEQTLQVLARVHEAGRRKLARLVDQHGVGKLRDAEAASQLLGQHIRKFAEPLVFDELQLSLRIAIACQHDIEPVALRALRRAHRRQERFADGAVRRYE